MAKPKSKTYVAQELKCLERSTHYNNTYPWNTGVYDGKYLYGDCWNHNPKAVIYGFALNSPIADYYIIGQESAINRWRQGINASGLPDVTGDTIINSYCTQTTFKQMLADKKAPCLLLINGCHMGAYIGEYTYNGKTYNTTEYTPNQYLGNGLCRSYCDEYGRRMTHKNGTVIGTWNKCGYLTSFLDYSDWDEPSPTPTPSKTVDELALEIYAGKWGTNPSRKEKITDLYGEDMYRQAQSRVNTIVSRVSWYQTEIKIADEILNGKWGNNPDRQSGITLKYGANAYRIAQGFVNSICTGEYTLADLYTAFDVMNGILCGTYGNGSARKTAIVNQYGETIYRLAQELVNWVMS